MLRKKMLELKLLGLELSIAQIVQEKLDGFIVIICESELKCTLENLSQIAWYP